MESFHTVKALGHRRRLAARAGEPLRARVDAGGLLPCLARKKKGTDDSVHDEPSIEVQVARIGDGDVRPLFVIS